MSQGKPVTIVTNAGPVRARTHNGFLAQSTELDSRWRGFWPLFRLRLTGTGTCSIDAKNALGEITEDVESYAADEATNDVYFPYPGEDAVEIRARYTGTCRGEML